MNFPEKLEVQRRLYWREYFLALRKQDELAARHFHRLAQELEKKRRLSKRWIAEQLPLL